MLAREELGGNQKPFLVKYCEESDYDHHGFGDLLALCGNQVKSNHCHSQDERVIIASVKRPFTIRNGDKSKKDRNGKGQKSVIQSYYFVINNIQYAKSATHTKKETLSF